MIFEKRVNQLIDAKSSRSKIFFAFVLKAVNSQFPAVE
jgi:hypothetical protein